MKLTIEGTPIECISMNNQITQSNQNPKNRTTVLPGSIHHLVRLKYRVQHARTPNDGRQTYELES